MTTRRSKHNLTRAEYLSGGAAMLYASRGNELPHAKLNPDAVREIRASRESPSELAARFKVHPNTVMAVRRFETWGWVR